MAPGGDHPLRGGSPELPGAGRQWIARASDCIVQYWKERNERKRRTASQPRCAAYARGQFSCGFSELVPADAISATASPKCSRATLLGLNTSDDARRHHGDVAMALTARASRTSIACTGVGKSSATTWMSRFNACTTSTSKSLLWRPDAGIRAPARAAALDDSRATAHAASFQSLAGPRHTIGCACDWQPT
jgi:hypothetical protein